MSLSVESRLPDRKILIAGDFRAVNGLPREGLARLNPNGSVDESFVPDLQGSVRSTAVQPDGRILIAGAFQEGAEQLIRLRADGTSDRTFQTVSVTPDKINAIFPLDDGNVLIGGTFAQVNGHAALYLARLWGNPPGAAAITVQGSQINIAWNALANRQYRVQYKDTLSDNTWTDLPGSVVAAGPKAFKTDSRGAQQRFYRVLQE